MSAVTAGGHPHSPWRDRAAFTWRVLMATTRRDWAWVLTIGLVISLVTLPQRIDRMQQFGWQVLPAITETALPFIASVIMYLGWALADAGDEHWRSRTTRVVYALLGASAVATAAGVSLWFLSGADDFVARMAASKGKAPPSALLIVVAEYVNLLILGGIIYAVAEVMNRRCQTQREFESVLRRRRDLEQQVLESRLSAMQAQVEPRFLFDTLVDIEALYERDAASAAGNLDRLISYLRAALPRLREAGSTVEAELELVRAYLEVVTALHGGRPQLTITMDDECRRRRFYPMLLLPLIQRAVRQPSGALPDGIAVDVRCGDRETTFVLRIALAGGCGDDPELARVRERLAGLYGPAATLQCVEPEPGVTELTLRVPAGGAAATR